MYGGCEQRDINALQVMQNKAARIASNSSVMVPRTQMFDQLQWMTVRQLIYYHTALTTFRIRSSQEPEYLNSILTRENMRGNIIIPNVTLELARQSFTYRGATQWNNIPQNIRSIDVPSRFKARLKKWVFENVDQF